MKAGFYLCFGLAWVLLAGVLSSCQPSPSMSTSLPAGPVPVSLLVSLDTSVQIKREGWIDYLPMGFGTLVYPNDLLKPDGGVALLCADMQTVLIVDTLGGNPCPFPMANQILVYDDMWFSTGARGIIPTTIPYILYPRSTTILEMHPNLRWHSTGAASYTVEIRQGNKPIWLQTNVIGDSLMYPEDAPALVAGRDYLLVVTDNTNNHSSVEDSNLGLGFQIVSADQRIEIEKQRQSILSLAGLDSAAQKLALALFDYNQEYGGRGLWGEASILLGEVILSQPIAPTLHLRLGDTQGRMKLWDEAQATYETALSQAQITGDLESQAEALAALWLITRDPSNYDQAVSLYEQIGAADEIEKLQEMQIP